MFINAFKAKKEKELKEVKFRAKPTSTLNDDSPFKFNGVRILINGHNIIIR